MVGLLGKRWWGVLIVFLSACVYIPPLYAVTLAVPATRMSVISFGVAVLLGGTPLFLAIAFGASRVVQPSLPPPSRPDCSSVTLRRRL